LVSEEPRRSWRTDLLCVLAMASTACLFHSSCNPLLLSPGIRLGNFKDHKATDDIQELLNLINVVFEQKPGNARNCRHLMKIALGTKINFFLQMTRPSLIGRPAALCLGITKNNSIEGHLFELRSFMHLQGVTFISITFHPGSSRSVSILVFLPTLRFPFGLTVSSFQSVISYVFYISATPAIIYIPRVSSFISMFSLIISVTNFESPVCSFLHPSLISFCRFNEKFILGHPVIRNLKIQ